MHDCDNKTFKFKDIKTDKNQMNNILNWNEKKKQQINETTIVYNMWNRMWCERQTCELFLFSGFSFAIKIFIILSNERFVCLISFSIFPFVFATKMDKFTNSKMK